LSEGEGRNGQVEPLPKNAKQREPWQKRGEFRAQKRHPKSGPSRGHNIGKPGEKNEEKIPAQIKGLWEGPPKKVQNDPEYSREGFMAWGQSLVDGMSGVKSGKKGPWKKRRASLDWKRIREGIYKRTRTSGKRWG